MKRCRTLEEYAEFVEVARRYLQQEIEKNTALNLAIDYCIEHGILSEFLRRYRSEVLGMLLEEFDAKKYERTIREEGRAEERKQINRLVSILIAQNRIEDLRRSTEDAKYQKLLMDEFKIE